MSTTNVNNLTNPIEMITQLAETQITAAIVTAAKSKKTVGAKVEKTFSEEIIENLAASRYAEEAAINLTRIFGREFESIADQILEFAQRLNSSSDATSSTKVKKPRANKAKILTATTTDESVDVSEKKPKKPRAKKYSTKIVENKETVTEVVDTTTNENIPNNKSINTTFTYETTINTDDMTTTTETVIEPSEEPVKKPAAAKKPRAKKVVVVVSEPASTGDDVAAATATTVKKPRAKKVKPVNDDDSSVNAVCEQPEKKQVSTKKPRAKKNEVVASVVQEIKPIESVTENEITQVDTTVPSSENTDILLTDEDFDAELAGFAQEWTDELVEEELSDIDDDE